MCSGQNLNLFCCVVEFRAYQRNLTSPTFQDHFQLTQAIDTFSKGLHTSARTSVKTDSAVGCCIKTHEQAVTQKNPFEMFGGFSHFCKLSE